MARQRYINTKIWSDTWISGLDPVEKLLFLYLLTNERTNIAGIYELPLKIMAVETGIEKDMIEKIFNRFKKDKKVYYKLGWIYITNFIKHQDSNNEKIKRGIELVLQSVPTNVIDALSIGYLYPSNYSNTNSNNNTNNIAEAELPPAVPLKALKREKVDPMAKIDLTAEIQKYIASPQRHVHIAGLWLKGHPPAQATRGALDAQFKRILRGATALVGYTDRKILDAIDFVEMDGRENKYDPTLETVLKKIDLI